MLRKKSYLSYTFLFIICLSLYSGLSLSFDINDNALVKFWEYYNKVDTVFISNDQEVISYYSKNEYKNKPSVFKKNPVTFVNGAMYVFKDKLIFKDGKIYDLTNYPFNRSVLYVFVKYIPDRNVVVVVYRGDTDKFVRLFFLHDTKLSSEMKQYILSKNPYLTKYVFKEEDRGIIGNFPYLDSLKQKAFVFLNSLLNSIKSMIPFFGNEKDKMDQKGTIVFDKKKAISALYWSGELESIDCKKHNLNDIEQSMRNYFYFIKDNAYAHQSSKVTYYLNKVKENCVYDGNKINSECVWYQLKDIFVNTNAPNCIFGETLDQIIDNKHAKCGQSALILSAIYRDLKGYILFAPYEPVTTPKPIEVDKLDKQYNYYKNLKHVKIGEIKNVYILGVYKGSKGHASLMFCDQPYIKNRKEKFSMFVHTHCKIVDSVTFSPKRDFMWYYDPLYTANLVSENDVCFFTSKSLVEYYGYRNYFKYIGIPVNHLIACSSDFI